MSNLTSTIKSYYKSNPLGLIMLSALFFRLLATVFSRGYGWHDDQFLIIEIAQSWVDGIDYYSWLPSADGTNPPEGFSFFYVGLHYLLFNFFEVIGILNPQTKMLFVRLLHALWSLLIVYYGFKITLHLSNIYNAKLVGWILALFWFFPMLSVRNLVEYTSIPFLLWGLWIVVKSDKNTKIMIWLWAGILFGLAFNIRFQTMLITGAIGLVILAQKSWKGAFFMGLGVFIPIIIFQGGIDYFVWGTPFIQLVEYVNYNMHNAAQYIISPWYTYLLFLAGILIPPVSIFILTGFFQQYRKLLILFLPILIFLIFHSYYPNKQERFVVTIMPMLIIIGIIGWQQIANKHLVSTFSRKLLNGIWIFFWIVNFIVLLPVTVMYSKQARVESMIYMARYSDINNFLIEDINQTVLRFPPQFYLQNWYNYKTLMEDDDFVDFAKSHFEEPVSIQPGFVLFYQPDNIDARVDQMKTVYPELEFEVIIEPGFMDRVMYWLNPINDNQNIYLYRNKSVLPHKLEN